MGSTKLTENPQSADIAESVGLIEDMEFIKNIGYVGYVEGPGFAQSAGFAESTELRAHIKIDKVREFSRGTLKSWCDP